MVTADQKGKAGAKGGKVGKKGQPTKAKEDAGSDNDEFEEVRESQWLGKALRRQQTRQTLEDAKGKGRNESSRGLKPNGGAKKAVVDGMPVSEDEDVSEEEEEGEKLAGFSFDGDEDVVDEIVGGWKMSASTVGARARRDPNGILSSMDQKISKRLSATKSADDRDEDDEDGDGDEDGDEDEDEGEEGVDGNESDASHISADEDDEQGLIKEGESENEGSENEEEPEEEEEKDDGDGLQDEEAEEAAKQRTEEARKRAALQRRMEEEAKFFDDAPAPAAAGMSFQELFLSRPLLKATTALGFSAPTLIQSMVIPVALQGKDVCASARTGSGKTAAFALPFLERLLFRPRRVAVTRVLVLTPTRELAVQAHSMIEKLAQFTDIRAYIVIGGVKNALQEQELRKKPDVVVATPGRMIDHLRNAPGIGFEGLEILVLDEADRLLEMGFTEEVQELVKMCPENRQTMLFSATMTHDVGQLAAYSLKKPVRITADGSIRTDEADGTLNSVRVPSTLHQEFVRIRREHEGDREAILLALCTRTFKTRCIVFAREKRRAHRLRILFGLFGLKVEELHGNLTQMQRLESLEKFRDGACDFLIATDLAGRGLDVTGIDVVINFEVPRNLSEYVHRVGRTARAGRKGKAITLADDSQRTKKMLKDIVRGAPEVIKRRVVPSDVIEAMRTRIEELEEDLDAVMEEEKVERELRKANMEEEKTRNMVEHEDEIQARPKKSWFQTKDEKRATRELNPASGRRILEDRKNGGKGKGGQAVGGEGSDEREPMISRSKVFTGKKEDKYAGMSRKKRRRVQDREMDELEAKREAAMESHARAHEMFAEDGGTKAKGKPKVLSQKAAKAAYRKGTLNLDKDKDKNGKKRRRQQDSNGDAKRSKSDADFYKESLDKELAASRKPRNLKKNKKQAVATKKSFKSVKRMKRR